MKILLVRHPRPAIPPGICYGRLDVPLHPDAGDDVRRLAVQIAGHGVTEIWSSPARRCRAVAEPAAAAGATPHFDPRLLEMDFGAWEGRAWDDIPRAALDQWAADPSGFTPPGGESAAAVLARVESVCRALIEVGKNCAVVSHGGPLKLLAALLRGEPPDLLAPAPALGSLQVIRRP